MNRVLACLAALVIVVSITGASAVQAHQLWLEPIEGERALLLHWGHSASAGHEGESSLPYLREAVVEARARGLNSSAELESASLLLPDTPGATEWPVRIADRAELIAVRLDAGVWTRTMQGTLRGGPTEHPDGFGSWQAWATVKRLTAWSEPFIEPVLAGLELTPLGDPFAAKPGGMLDVRVTLNSTPVEGAIVSYADKPRGTTGPEGVVRIRLREAGVQHIAAVYEEQHAGAPIGRTLHEAFLQFDLEAR